MKESMVDHIAFATNSTEKSREIFSLLGFKEMLVDKGKIDKFGSAITKLQSIHGQVLELVEPLTEDSVVRRILQGRDAMIYHAAFYTADLEKMLGILQSAGALIITDPMEIPYPATPAHRGYKTSHVFHPYAGLFEVTGPMKS